MKTTSISLLLGVCFLFVSGASAKGGYIEVGDATAGSCATITNSFQGVTTYTSSGNDDAKCYCGNNMMPDAAYPAGTECMCNDQTDMTIDTTGNDEDGNQQPFCKCGTGKKVNANGDACEDDGAPTAATPTAGGGGATPAAPAGGGGATPAAPADDAASDDDAADDDKDAATSIKPSTLIYPLLICFSFKMMSL